MSDSILYKNPNIPDTSFPISIVYKSHVDIDTFIAPHWHKQMEFLFFIKGKALIQSGLKSFNIVAGNFIVINCNEIHSGHNYNRNEAIEYICVILDSSIFHSFSFDSCEAKYITPILQNLILFNNKVDNDIYLNELLKKIYEEYVEKKIGYELAIKANIFNTIVFLLRNSIERILTISEYNKRNKFIEMLNPVFKYIDENYSKDITPYELADLANVNKFYISRIFKDITNMTIKEYITHFRIKKAEYLLKSTNQSITEIALNTGFNDINYFSRLFKSYLQISPSQYRNNITKQNFII
jgi:AraC-type DNA-binding domain-containing proteins